MQLMITVTDFVYTTGQGGTPIYADDFTMVEKAAILNVPQTASSLAITADVSAVGLACGTIAGSAPVGNEILIFAANIESGTIIEAASGTIGSLTLLVEGN